MMLSMFHYSFLIFFLIPTVGSLNFTGPQVRGERGKSVTLTCIGVKGKSCIWTKEDFNGQSNTIATSYSDYTRKYDLDDYPKDGECSLTIFNLAYEDEGNLTCIIWPDRGSFTAIWELLVGKKPEQILIQHDGVDLNSNINLNEIHPDEEGKTVISCIVGEAKPPAKVEWIGDISSEDEISEAEISTWNNLTTVVRNLTLKIKDTDMKPERTVRCIAFHDLYQYGQKIKTVTVTVKYATKNVFIMGDSKIIPGDEVICQADGFPKPSIRWQYKEFRAEEWSILTSSDTARIKKYGEYRCQARNELNSDQWKSSPRKIIFDPNGISKICTSP